MKANEKTKRNEAKGKDAASLLRNMVDHSHPVVAEMDLRAKKIKELELEINNLIAQSAKQNNCTIGVVGINGAITLTPIFNMGIVIDDIGFGKA